jgi:hypothetical protein
VLVAAGGHTMARRFEEGQQPGESDGEPVEARAASGIYLPKLHGRWTQARVAPCIAHRIATNLVFLLF